MALGINVREMEGEAKPAGFNRALKLCVRVCTHICISSLTELFLAVWPVITLSPPVHNP